MVKMRTPRRSTEQSSTTTTRLRRHPSTLLSLCLVAITLFDVFPLSSAGTNCTEADSTRNCVDGLVVPIWRPFLDLQVEERVLRGILYFFSIGYMFLGVSIVADRFMSSIEVITR